LTQFFTCFICSLAVNVLLLFASGCTCIHREKSLVCIYHAVFLWLSPLNSSPIDLSVMMTFCWTNTHHTLY